MYILRWAAAEMKCVPAGAGDTPSADTPNKSTATLAMLVHGGG